MNYNNNNNDRTMTSVDDITSQFGGMNVQMNTSNPTMMDMDMQAIEHHLHSNQSQYQQLPAGYQIQGSDGATSKFGTDVTAHSMNNQYNYSNNNNNSGSNPNWCNVLIVTNLDLKIFNEPFMREKFESLFLVYDPNITFTYLKSFRRVRLDFSNPHLAYLARSNLASYRLGDTEFKCYHAQIIKPNNNNQNNQDLMNTMENNSSAFDDGYEFNSQNRVQNFNDESDINSMNYLRLPKLTRQHLISPPVSPPVGWKPKEESTPCIDVQLISALANLVPGKMHEIHPATESQPGIFVEVCEDPQFDRSSGLMNTRSSRIPPTMSPYQTIQ